VVDDFEHLEGWSTTASEGAQVWIAQEPGKTGMGMRIDYDLGNSSGYVIIHKEVSLSLPANFAFTFQLHGEGPRNNFEFKLVDPSGQYVWWWRQRDFAWPIEWQQMTVRKAALELAWGASPDQKLSKVGAIEFAIKAGEGGSGSVWIDDLTLEERPVPGEGGEPQRATASSAMPDREADRVLDGEHGGWRSEPAPEEQWLVVDFGQSREYGGVIVDWDPDDYATAFDVDTSTDGERWTTALTTDRGTGRRDYLYLPDSESRWLRFRLRHSSRGQGYGIRRLQVQSIAFSASPNYFFEHVAREEPRGLFPKYFLGEQTYWTVVGVDGDGKQGLLNEEGMLEVDRGGFSIEPFLWLDDKLVTWADVDCTQSLEDDYLPIPTVTWRQGRLTLRVTTFASGKPGASLLFARYRIENPSDRRVSARLFLALRPFQVLPPWQALNMVGGVSPIREIRYDSGVVRVNRSKAIVALAPPEAFGAVSFDEAGITEVLRDGRMPPQAEVSDPSGFASAALSYRIDLRPGERQEVVLAVPFHEPYVEALAASGDRSSRTLAATEQQATRRHWQTLLGRVDIDLPPSAARLVHTAKTSLAYALINRDGPALQPGPRNYARSWIRDGAVTSTALLEMGFQAEVRDFLQWFATFQFPDGKIPCCIDRRGPDAVPEHDSNGEFVWLVGEYYRFTRDVGLVADLWSNVVRAVEYLATLRARQTDDRYRTPEMAAYFGILPESISHEGYSSHPVHAYWDDFWALAGLRAAAMLAVVVGDIDRAEAFAALRDSFEEDFLASVGKAMEMHGIDFVPGSVELGDFDPTSTAVAVTAAGVETRLAEPLGRTFTRYMDEVRGRIDGSRQWNAYSPYELRNVEALVRLGRRSEANELLDWIVDDQRPPGWNEWAEVSWHDRKAPRFIGDMPHTWIGSIFVHSLRTMLVYERESDRALVIGAGIPAEWMNGPHGVGVKRLPTYYGALSYDLRATGPDTMRLRLLGDLNIPPGKIVVTSPFTRPITGVTVNGRTVSTFSADAAVVDECPAEVVLRYGPEPTEARPDGQPQP
jgi:hypothetical protein